MTELQRQEIKKMLGQFEQATRSTISDGMRSINMAFNGMAGELAAQREAMLGHIERILGGPSGEPFQKFAPGTPAAENKAQPPESPIV